MPYANNAKLIRMPLYLAFSFTRLLSTLDLPQVKPTFPFYPRVFLYLWPLTALSPYPSLKDLCTKFPIDRPNFVTWIYCVVSTFCAHQLPQRAEPLTCLKTLLRRPWCGWCPWIKLDAVTCLSDIWPLSIPAAALQSLYPPSVDGLVEKVNYLNGISRIFKESIVGEL